MAAGGFFLLLLLAAGLADVPIVPWLAGWTGIACLFYRHAAFPERGGLQVVAAVGLGIGLSVLHLSHFASAVFPPGEMFFALLAGFPIVLQLVAQLRRDEEVRLSAQRAAATLPVLLLVFLAAAPFTLSLEALPALGGGLILGVLALTAATRLGHGRAAGRPRRPVSGRGGPGPPGLAGDRSDTPQRPGMVLGGGAVFRCGRHPAAAREAVDHHRLGPGGAGGPGPLEAAGSPRPEVPRPGAPGSDDGAPGRQSRASGVLRALDHPDRELADV